MAHRARTAFAAVVVVLALAPIDAAHAAPTSTHDSVLVPAGDVGTTAIRFREEWSPATVEATNGVAAPFVGSFDAAVVEFMGLQVVDGRSYDVTAFDGEQSGEAELTVPAGATLDPGTYSTDATASGTDVPGFFFHGYKGYAGYGTGSFTVVRSTYDDAGQLVSFLATYDEVLTDQLGDSHVVGDVSWADTGDVPQVAEVSAVADPVVTGHPIIVRGMLQTTAGLGGTLEVTRISHGRSSALPDVTADLDGSFAFSDRPPCAGGVTYAVSAPETPNMLGEQALVTIPLVRCTTGGGPGPGGSGHPARHPKLHRAHRH